MILSELVVTPRSNNNLVTNNQTLILPFDIELVAANGYKVLHEKGTKVGYKILQTFGSGFKIKLFRTAFSTVLSFDSKKECQDEGFDI